MTTLSLPTPGLMARRTLAPGMDLRPGAAGAEVVVVGPVRRLRAKVVAVVQWLPQVAAAPVVLVALRVAAARAAVAAMLPVKVAGAVRLAKAVSRLPMKAARAVALRLRTKAAKVALRQRVRRPQVQARAVQAPVVQAPVVRARAVQAPVEPVARLQVQVAQRA